MINVILHVIYDINILYYYVINAPIYAFMYFKIIYVVNVFTYKLYFVGLTGKRLIYLCPLFCAILKFKSSNY